MRILSQTAATYFCGGFSPGTAATPIDDFVERSRRRAIAEGASLYDDYRDNLLRDTDRAYYVALSCFRRAHDALIASSAFWAHVGFYYSSWFAARAILGTHGVWANSKRVVGVVHEAAGSQEFRVTDNPNRSLGSHKAFWAEYYSSVAPLRLTVDPAFILALDPVTANVHWQIETRNRLNYIMPELQRLSDVFRARFDPLQFPLSLPGETATQYAVTRATLLLAAQLLSDFGVATDVFASRATSIQSEIFDPTIPTLFSTTDVASFAV